MKWKSAGSWIGLLAIVASLLAALAGCRDGAADPPGNQGKSGFPNGNREAPITFDFFSEDPILYWDNGQDRVSRTIAERTGVSLNAEFATGDPAQKIRLLIASGDFPDLISAKGDLSKLVDAGAVLDLTDLINQYAPHIKQLFRGSMNRLRYSNSDHAIYAIPTYSGVDNTSFVAGGGFELQHAVVMEEGYPRIRTVQDFEQAIQTYKDKHPTINGQPTIGLSLNADDWHMYISVTNPAAFVTGKPDDGEYYIDPVTYEATYHYRTPGEKEYFKWLNHMNAIGLLDPESFVQKYEQYKAKIATGRVLGLIDQDWDYADGEKALKAAGLFDRTYGHYPVTLDESKLDHSFQSLGFNPGWGIAISKTCKDPVRAIRFLDYLASDEGQVLINWGVEGQDYVLQDGKRVIPDSVNARMTNDAADFFRESGTGFYHNIGPHYGDGVKDPSGNYYTTSFPDQIIAGYSEVEKNVLSHYHAAMWKDLFPPQDRFPAKAWGTAWDIPVPGDSDAAVLGSKMKEITWQRIPEMILASPDRFEALWDQYQQELIDAGVERMEADFSRYVQERVRLWRSD